MFYCFANRLANGFVRNGHFALTFNDRDSRHQALNVRPAAAWLANRRLLKLARYTVATDRIVRAFHLVREELILFYAIALLSLYLSSIGIYYFEHDAQPDKFASVFHAMWWSAVTLTTVGYGDVYPITAGGRIFTVVVLFIALGIIAVPTGLFASALSRLHGEEAAQAKEKKG